jgi:phage-related minor tail protein
MSILPESDVVATDDDLSKAMDRLHGRTNALGTSATQFASVFTKAFTDVIAGGKKFDDVLKSVGLRLSTLAVQQAFKPVAKDIAGGLSGLLGNLFPGVIANNKNSGANNSRSDALTFGGLSSSFEGFGSKLPFSSGGLAGESGPEAIVPLARRSDGSLETAMTVAKGPMNVTVHITTPDAGSFRRSEAYISGQIARAVARGHRSF